MTRQSKTIIISEHYEPSTSATAQLVHDLAVNLSTFGCKVVVLTSTPSLCNNPSIEVHRFIGTNSTSISILSKILQGVTFFCKSLFWVLQHLRRCDKLLIVSNPPFIGLIGPVIKALYRVDYHFVLQDIFPHSAEIAGIFPPNGFLSLLWRSLQRQVLIRSLSTVVLSEDMFKTCIAEYGNTATFQVIHNWSPIRQLHQPLSATHYTTTTDYHSLTLLYSGNFGRLHDILTILEASRLTTDLPINYIFRGEGAKKIQILTYMALESPKPRIRLESYVPRENLGTSLQQADLIVVSLIPGADRLVAPSKLYSALHLGKPILLIANPNCNLSLTIKKHSLGYVVEPGDAVGLSNTLRHLLRDPSTIHDYSLNAREFYSTRYGQQISARLYYNLLFENHNK